jgi:hypothetical protein
MQAPDDAAQPIPYHVLRRLAKKKCTSGEVAERGGDVRQEAADPQAASSRVLWFSGACLLRGRLTCSLGRAKALRSRCCEARLPQKRVQACVKTRRRGHHRATGRGKSDFSARFLLRAQ